MKRKLMIQIQDTYVETVVMKAKETRPNGRKK